VVLLAAAALLVTGALLFVLTQDPNRYREEVVALLSEAAGYPVEIGGDLSLDWRPSPTVTARDLRLRGPRGDLRVDLVQLSAEPQALLARRLRARSVVLQGVHARVDLERAPGSEAAVPDPGTIPVDLLELRDVVVEGFGREPLHVTRLTLGDPQHPDGARVSLDMASPPIRAEARVRATGPRVDLRGLRIRIPAGSLEGRLVLSLDGPRPRLAGELGASAITLAGEPGGTAPGPPKKLIPRVPIDLGALDAIDAEVRLRIGRLSVAGVRVSQLSVPLQLDAGRLQGRVSAMFAGGPMTVDFAVSAQRRDWQVGLAIDDADAGDTLLMLGVSDAENGGRLAARVSLTATGASVDEVLSSLEGHLAVDAGAVSLRTGVADIATSDVFAAVTRAVRGEDSGRINLECAVLRFQVRGGILRGDQGIGVQGRTMNVLGGGTISLPAERLNLVLRPWPREGLGLSASAVVGTVGVTGPLADPEVGLTSEAAWRGGASAGAALLTGGLSLIAQGLMERSRGDAPCQQAAGRGAAPGSASARGGQGAGRGGSGPVGAGLSEAMRDAGEKLKGLLPGGTSPPASSERPDP
jgi:hypothetical protein